MNLTDPSTSKTPARSAIEDALLVSAINLVTSLLAVTALGLPDLIVLYTTGLPAILVGLTTYATKRGIIIGKD